MAGIEDDEPRFEFSGCCQFVSQPECYLNAAWGFLCQCESYCKWTEMESITNDQKC